jgi:group I intron endonuclease
MILNLADTPLWVIYGLRLVDDPEYRYIGYTTIGTKKRLSKHRRDTLYRDFHVHRWMRAHGRENVTIDVLEECPVGNLPYISEAEEFWIGQIRSFGHRLTNLNAGGVGGNSSRMHSEETKRKISESLLSNPNLPRGESHPCYGKPLSAEHKAKMSASLTGNTHTPETKEIMRQHALTRDDTIRLDKVRLGNHTRWHTNRSIVKDDCQYCTA